MVDRKHNRPQQRVVHLEEDLLEFAVNNCDVNIRTGLALLQSASARHAGDGGRSTAEKMVEMLENFKLLRRALREAE